MKEKLVCRICFLDWLMQGKGETITAEQLLNSDYAFETESDFIKHVEEKHNLQVVYDG